MNDFIKHIIYKSLLLYWFCIFPSYNWKNVSIWIYLTFFIYLHLIDFPDHLSTGESLGWLTYAASGLFGFPPFAGSCFFSSDVFPLPSMEPTKLRDLIPPTRQSVSSILLLIWISAGYSWHDLTLVSRAHKYYMIACDSVRVKSP